MMSKRIFMSIGSKCDIFLNSRMRYSTVLTNRIEEINPINHTFKDLSSFYQIPEKDRNKLFAFGGLPKPFDINVNTFGETCLMLRNPSIEIINYLKNTDFDRPPVRYLIYGKPGCGKSLTLAHVLHYAYLNDFIIIHVPWIWNWFRGNRTEVAYSTTRPGLIDLPVVAANWLKHFQSQNEILLEKLDLKTEKDYVWNQRETTPAGSSLHELITHGINRVKYSSDCVQALISEIKQACRDKKCKSLVALDGFNALLGTSPTNLKTEDKIKVNPFHVTLSKTMMDTCKQDWTNAAVVLIADQMAGKHEYLNNHYPLYLLRRQGFELIDPFVPISVEEFTDREFHSMMDYYEEKKWYTRKDGRVELSFLCNKNPYKLMNMCGGL